MTVLIVQDCHAVCENKDGCTDFTWHSPAAEVFTSTLTFDIFHFHFRSSPILASCSHRASTRSTATGVSPAGDTAGE